MLVVQNVSKVYHLYRRPSDRLLEALRRKSMHTDFWALRNVSFSLAPGDILGIVGPNGSGKSTLLQIVCGILRPTKGRVSAEGRIAALLELGAGFNPEFSGRENVYLSGEITGLTRRQMERAFPAIEKFAEIGAYIDRPVKEYSSGMYVRLAFSTAIHIDPEILVVDEALAVGDAIFANRCIKRLEEMKKQGVTILLVSHDLGLVKRLCHRAMLMMNGEAIVAGAPGEVVNRYVGLVHERELSLERLRQTGAQFRHGDRSSRILGIELLDAGGRPAACLHSGEAACVRVRAAFESDVDSPIVGILIRNRLGMDVFGTNTRLEGVDLGRLHAGEELEIDFRFPCLFTRHDYTLTVATQHADGSSQDWLDDALEFSVIDHREKAGVVNLETKITWQKTSPLLNKA
ncbi:MAG: ABC transporter ATP-binding protein [Acidobacteria bacterium]|nr:ABC transporter ATP-binding protein [Acidobacteriota bacterium]MBI3281925.1 ABC transporter ATP-binding protein [Acidobacteriota bacterium]